MFFYICFKNLAIVFIYRFGKLINRESEEFSPPDKLNIFIENLGYFLILCELYKPYLTINDCKENLFE